MRIRRKLAKWIYPEAFEEESWALPEGELYLPRLVDMVLANNHFVPKPKWYTKILNFFRPNYQ